MTRNKHEQVTLYVSTYKTNDGSNFSTLQNDGLSDL